MLKFVFTCGDINGIGPEIVVKSLNKITVRNSSSKFFFLCPSNILDVTFSNINPSFDYEIIKKSKDDFSYQVSILDLGKVKLRAGIPTKLSGETAYKALYESFKIVDSGVANAVITAPVSKTALKMAGFSRSNGNVC